MSTESLSFALSQSQLNPTAQLALIVIADGLGDFFTIQEAVRCVITRTRLNTTTAKSTVEHLIKYQMLHAYLGSQGSYYVPAIELSLSTEMPERSRPIPPNFRGYVYLIQSSTGAYKIGKTVNPKSRFQTFRQALPFEVEFVCVIQSGNMSQLERDLHQKFADKRINGEWYNLTPEDVEYMKGLAS